MSTTNERVVYLGIEQESLKYCGEYEVLKRMVGNSVLVKDENGDAQYLFKNEYEEVE